MYLASVDMNCISNMFEMSQIQELSCWITNSYGSKEEIRKRLDYIVFMLHFLQEDTFTPREIQDAVELLKGLGEVLE
ncbi:hypothetical protein [Flagellimonas meridianipacifica]|uniref:Uncharacterized protein n=1 Tax=Flagellimonas meridianipacifica TaxID=1080225 RepID=A0A2T0MGF9_9FLAO|nr:hypothetical protein [Allomuricauda pacifica]PRX56661.1 hypothetical protein CLV81_0658 [Allomuricauda pacifica]